jgi:hypothetical protein
MPIVSNALLVNSKKLLGKQLASTVLLDLATKEMEIRDVISCLQDRTFHEQLVNKQSVTKATTAWEKMLIEFLVTLENTPSF